MLMQWASQGVMGAALLQLVNLMLSRYSCSPAEDEELLQQLQQLPPRKQAAVVARAAEKRCLVAMKKGVMEGEEAVAGGEWQQQVESAVKEGLKGLVQRRADKREEREQEDEEGESEEEGDEEGESEEEEEEEEEEDMGEQEKGNEKHGGRAYQDKSRCRPSKRKECPAEHGSDAADGGGKRARKQVNVKPAVGSNKQSREAEDSSKAAAGPVGFTFDFAV